MMITTIQIIGALTEFAMTPLTDHLDKSACQIPRSILIGCIGIQIENTYQREIDWKILELRVRTTSARGSHYTSRSSPHAVVWDVHSEDCDEHAREDGESNGPSA